MHRKRRHTPHTFAMTLLFLFHSSPIELMMSLGSPRCARYMTHGSITGRYTMLCPVRYTCGPLGVYRRVYVCVCVRDCARMYSVCA